MQAHFSAHTLAEIFRDLFVGERSGVLTLTREDGERRFFFRAGLLVFADSDRPEDDLGKFLVANGTISDGALTEGEASCDERIELGRILVQRDLLTRDELADAVRELVPRVVAGTFQWSGGTAGFQEAAELPDYYEGDVLHTVDSVLFALESMTGFDPIRDALLGLDNKIEASRPAPIPLERMRFTPTQGYLMSRIDGSANVNEVVAILPDGEEDAALRFVFGLLMFGVFEHVPAVADGPFRVSNILRDHADRQALEKIQENTIAEAYRTMPQSSPFDILGVSPDASRDAIDRAYEEAKAIFGKDRVLPHLREKYRAELAMIESRLIESYLKLSQPEGERPAASVRTESAGARSADDLLVRVEMDKTKRKLELEEAARVADEYYQMAKKALRESDYHNAIQYSKLAISYNKDDARYYFTLADCQGRNPEARWQRMAEENFVKATQLDPWNPEYLVRLGRFYKKRGLKLRAIKQFEEALKLAPAHEAATRELRSLR